MVAVPACHGAGASRLRFYSFYGEKMGAEAEAVTGWLPVHPCNFLRLNLTEN